jgi:hypothetical protein
MRRSLPILVLLPALAGTAFAAPRPAVPRPAAPLSPRKAPAPATLRRTASLSPQGDRVQLLSAKQTRRFMDKVARKENRFYQPGVGFDGRTGMTFDGQNIDFKTGKPVFTRSWSAPSKESLHVALLVKALAGDRTAQIMISPDPKHPAEARQRALDVLTRKIASYEKFNREYPGFGGFLPWYQVADGHAAPVPTVWSQKPDKTPVKGEGWENRVPSLDNGQLAWSLYYAANTLKALGYDALAKRYQAHFDLMRKNAVKIFYDPKAKQMRAEARLLRGNKVAPTRNAYAINQDNPYYLSDAYEGMMFCHFADLFGNWRSHPEGKEAIWATPRRTPATYKVPAKGKQSTSTAGSEITIVKPWVGSSHEEWGQVLLPFSDVAIDKKLFLNSQRARTSYSALNGIPGLFASVHAPIKKTAAPEYRGLLGYRAPGATIERSVSRDIVTPYAAFPLALVPGGKPLFATWLKTMTDAPRMFGPCGIGESCSVKGDKMAPCLTWDGKALPMLAYMGGIRNEVRSFLQRDGLYTPFVKRVEADYRLFDSAHIEGTNIPMMAPTSSIPKKMTGFQK